MRIIFFLGLMVFIKSGQAQNTNFHKSYISSSIGVAFPLGEFGSVNWYDNQSVSLACSGVTSDLITYGNFFNKNIGIGGKLNTTINPMYDNGSTDKKPIWTSVGVGVGGLYNIAKPNWDYGVEIWASYMWLSGKSIFINNQQLINSPFYGTTVEFSPNISYHVTPRSSLILKSSVTANIGKIKHGWANDVRKKQYQMVKFQLGLRHWID